MDTPPPLPSGRRLRALRDNLFFKIVSIGLLGLVLLIPLAMVDSTLRERLGLHQHVVTEITGTWGRAQQLVGPILVVPYTHRVRSEEWVVVNGQRFKESKVDEVAGEAFCLPERLEVTGDLEPSERRRGIYRTHVYTAALRMSGSFRRPGMDFLNLPDVTPHWDRARVGVAFSDLRGTREALSLTWAGSSVPLEPGARLEGFTTGLHAPVDLSADAQIMDFALALTVNGSAHFSVVPVGRQTEVNLTSTWASPGFHGAYLPVTRDVGAEGFSATWRTSHYGRDYPQQWSNRGGEPGPDVARLGASALGVTLAEPVNAYRTVERATKYGVLFITLVFTTFFLFEAISGLRLNALNYLLVGAALCLFYLSLLALSEFMLFGAAYALAAGASMLLIGLYSRRILGGGRRALGVTALLGGVYAYLYFVLQLEDFALLAGTAALFVMLAAVMYATRNLHAGAQLEEAVP